MTPRPSVSPLSNPSAALPAPTAVVARADAVFASTSPYGGDGLRNHCLRLYAFATALMARDGLVFPADHAYLLAMVHDLGLVSEQDHGPSYLDRSWALWRRVTADLGCDQQVTAVAQHSLLYNHRVRQVAGLHPVGECFRRAVWIEHARGRLSFGLPSACVRATFATFPRADLDGVLLDFAVRTLRREPRTVVTGMFWGPPPPAAGKELGI